MLDIYQKAAKNLPDLSQNYARNMEEYIPEACQKYARIIS
jgi:hypothetical protein